MKDHKENNHQHHENSSGHHHEHMIEQFRRLFVVSMVLTLPILALSPMIQGWLGFSFRFVGDKYVLLGLSIIVYAYCGKPFLTGAWSELKAREPSMMTLIALAISVAFFYSLATTFGLDGKDFFWELATLIDVMLLGHWIEMKSIAGASNALELLVAMMPSEAHRIADGKVEDVPLQDIQVGDHVIIRPGEKIPTDGTIIEGESYLNESMLTGESKPVQRKDGDTVIGGSINGKGSLKVVVTHTGKSGYLQKVIQLVEQAQASKSKTQHLADKAARILVFAALFSGLATLIVWVALGKPFDYALGRMVTVMVISCPHALGLAIPLVVANSTALAARNGLLIRNRTAFENARKITTMVFDKTGTLTTGNFGVTRIASHQPDWKEEDIIRFAAALETHSEHPIATGIINKVKAMDITAPSANGFQSITGAGVTATVEGKAVAVVSPGYLREHQLIVPKGGNDMETIVYLIVEDQLVGEIALSDEVRADAATTVSALKKLGVKVIMATGDNERVAKAVAEKLGLDDFHAAVLPHEKVDIVKKLQAQKEFVCMTGDGVNDAPALAQANIGLAVGSGTDVAAETADIILVQSDPSDILNLVRFGRATYAKMMQNLVWATAYNVLAIPLAAGVLAGVGFVLEPAVGAVFMSLSTIVVAVNAQLLRLDFKTAKSG